MLQRTVYGRVILLIVLALSAAPAQAATKHLPVVFVPGFLGWDRLPVFDRYCEGACATLEHDGHVVVVVQSAAVASSDDRKDAVVRAIDEARAQAGADRVVVVAHSQGGIDVRRALQDPAVAQKVGAVVTLATPHDGTPVATLAGRAPGVAVDVVLGPIQWLWETFEQMEPSRRTASRSRDALETLALHERGRALFTAHGAALDDDDSNEPVPFFSVAGFTGRLHDGDHSCEGGRWSAPRVVDDPGAWMLAGRAAHDLEGWGLANDGIVPAASARHGVFLGCVPADHLDWLGWHHSWSSGSDAVFDEDEFVAIVVECLEDVAAGGSVDAWVPRLASIAHAKPTSPW